MLALSDMALTPHHGSGERKQQVMRTPNPSPQQSTTSRRGASVPGQAVGRQPREPPDPRVVRCGLSAVKDRPGVCRLQDPQTRSRAGTTQSCIAQGGEGIAGHHCHSPAPQSSPVLPGGHRHCPVTRSQGAPPQKQEPEQFTPNVPPAHSAGRNKMGGAALLPQHSCWAQTGPLATMGVTGAGRALSTRAGRGLLGLTVQRGKGVQDGLCEYPAAPPPHPARKPRTNLAPQSQNPKEHGMGRGGGLHTPLYPSCDPLPAEWGLPREPGTLRGCGGP